MSDDVQPEAWVTEDVPQPTPDKPQRVRKRAQDAAAPVVSLAALAAREQGAERLVRQALNRGGFVNLGSLRRYLGGATELHALTWLGLRTQLFTVTD